MQASPRLDEAGQSAGLQGSIADVTGQHTACTQLHRGTIDLLVSDVVMPQMGGPELWRTLAPDFPSMRRLFITGYAERELPGDAPFLKKPFAPDTLARRVRETLDH
jgi:two-component system cell cycle sensor histidine kinase/response regulator CckA